MSLWDRVQTLFQRAKPAAAETTSDGLPPVATVRGLAEALGASSDRRAIVRACRTMYRKDTRCRRVHLDLARDMVRGGFSVSAPGQPRAEEMAADLVQRLGLDQRLDDWVRLALRDGDCFLELAVDRQMQIASVTRKPTLQMRRNSDEKDVFADPKLAFWQGDEAWLGDGAPANAVWFAEWQMIHARWDHDEEDRYGKPLFDAATDVYRRVREGEMDVAVRRKTRAGIKYVHQFPQGTDAPTITAYKEMNRDTLNNPTAAIADYFGTVDIKVLQGDAQIGNIDDIMHHIRTLFLASPVPMSLLGYGQDLNRDVLDPQKEQYEDALEGLTNWVEIEFVRPLLERQWLLGGIYPPGLNYEVKWKLKGVLTPEKLAKVTDAALRLKALGAPDELIWAILARFLPGIDVEMLKGKLSAPMGGVGPAPAGRVADVAGALGAKLR